MLALGAVVPPSHPVTAAAAGIAEAPPRVLPAATVDPAASVDPRPTVGSTGSIDPAPSGDPRASIAPSPSIAPSIAPSAWSGSSPRVDPSPRIVLPSTAPSQSPSPSVDPPAVVTPPVLVTPSASPSPSPKPSLIARAIVARVTPFRAGTFRATGYGLPRLGWRSLPYNGLGLLSTALTGRNVDAQGVPYKTVGGRRYYNPGTIASQACRYVDAYVRTGNPVYLDRAQRRADRLRLLTIKSRGASWLAYRFNWWAEGLRAPWASALAQGSGLSLFVRLYRVTGNRADLAMARGLFLGFRMLGRSHSPWVGYVDRAGYLRLEEYPGPRPSHVLNGANFGYFGIYDYAMLTGDPTALALARGHLTAMRKYAVLYRVPGGLSYYDLVHRSRTVHYHAVDTWQLAMLGRMGGGSYFTHLSAKFHADYPYATYP